MKNKEMIIFLIKQDMIHSRLVMGLEKLGLQVDDKHSLGIMAKVAELMEVGNEEKEEWFGRYLDLRGSVNSSGFELEVLAEKCYDELALCQCMVIV